MSKKHWVLFDGKVYSMKTRQAAELFVSLNEGAEHTNEANPKVVEKIDEILALAAWEVRLYGGGEVPRMFGLED